MQDFLCINDALKRDKLDVLQAYNEMHTTGKQSATYTALIIDKWAGYTLGKLIQTFFEEWSQWKNHNRVSYAFKIMEIHRNAFSHAYMPASGDYLLFTPNNRTKTLIRETNFPTDKLERNGSQFPFVLVLPCLHEPFVIDFYERIKLIDFACFWKVASELGIHNYPGLMADPDWPLTVGVDPVTLAPSRPQP